MTNKDLLKEIEILTNAFKNKDKDNYLVILILILTKKQILEKICMDGDIEMIKNIITILPEMILPEMILP